MTFEAAQHKVTTREPREDDVVGGSNRAPLLESWIGKVTR